MLNNRPLWVTIPTIGHSPLLIPLVNELEKDRAIDKIVLTVNLEEYVEPIQDFFRFGGPTIEVWETWQLGKSLYHGWNTAIEAARKEDAFLAVLNDDIRLFEDYAVSRVAQLLADHSSYAVVGLNWQDSPDQREAPSQLRRVHGSYRHHGVGGFAWVCDPHKVDTIPQDIVHWGGDDFIFLRAEGSGHNVGIANHVHVEHPAPETTSVTQPWTYEARGNDRKVFERYFPGKGW
jgi:hypothetical protein